MAIAGIGGNQYPYYGTQYPKNNTVKTGASAAVVTPSNLNLHIGSEDDKDGKALGALGFSDGSNSSVFKGENYSTDHPVFKIKTWDRDGIMTETEVDASKVDPSNASVIEMMALNANRKLNGEDTFGDQLMMTAASMGGDHSSSQYEDFYSKIDWVAKMKENMDMQYRAGNMAGYFQYKNAAQLLQDIVLELGTGGRDGDR